MVDYFENTTGRAEADGANNLNVINDNFVLRRICVVALRHAISVTCQGDVSTQLAS